MKKITDGSQLIVGEWYWCQYKKWPEHLAVKQVEIYLKYKYLGECIWIDQAMEMWNIVGPLKRPTDSKFRLTINKE